LDSDVGASGATVLSLCATLGWYCLSSSGILATLIMIWVHPYCDLGPPLLWSSFALIVI
jgi:hypothetical protein